MNRPLHGATRTLLALGLGVWVQVAAAETLVDTRCSVAASDAFLNLFPAASAPASGSPQILAGRGFRGVVNTVTQVVHDVTTAITNTVNPVSSFVVAVDETCTVKFGTAVQSVIIKAEVQGVVKDSFKTMTTVRPEWLVDPPYWLNYASICTCGVSFTTVGALTTLAVAAAHGDLRWNDQTRAMILNALTAEARMKVQELTGVDAATMTPVSAQFITPVIEYGFDRAVDTATDRVSQSFGIDKPAYADTKALLGSNRPIQVSYHDGALLTSVVVANGITIGCAADSRMTVVVPIEGGNKPSYFAAVQGAIVVTGTTAILGNVVLTSASSASGLPQEIKDQVSIILNQSSTTPQWVDNVSPSATTAVN